MDLDSFNAYVRLLGYDENKLKVFKLGEHYIKLPRDINLYFDDNNASAVLRHQCGGVQTNATTQYTDCIFDAYLRLLGKLEAKGVTLYNHNAVRSRANPRRNKKTAAPVGIYIHNNNQVLYTGPDRTYCYVGSGGTKAALERIIARAVKLREAEFKAYNLHYEVQYKTLTKLYTNVRIDSTEMEAAA